MEDVKIFTKEDVSRSLEALIGQNFELGKICGAVGAIVTEIVGKQNTWANCSHLYNKVNNYVTFYWRGNAILVVSYKRKVLTKKKNWYESNTYTFKSIEVDFYSNSSLNDMIKKVDEAIEKQQKDNKLKREICQDVFNYIKTKYSMNTRQAIDIIDLLQQNRYNWE